MEILAGKPYLWKSAVYGEIAVHVKGFSPNGTVAVLTIDGGEASTPAQRFPEWSDGIAYAALKHGELVKRPSRRAPKAPVNKAVAPTSEETRISVTDKGVMRPVRRTRSKAAQGTNNGEVQF